MTPQGWQQTTGTRQVLALFAARGWDIRFVGGCVRDGLLGQVPADVDLATPVRPRTVMRLLGSAGIRVVPTGIAHGTVTVVLPDGKLEITTLRRDISTDGRRAVVAFSRSWRVDAMRRDFTINALNADSDGQVEDWTGGLRDLAEGRVRFIGEADHRIREDVLRILRFFRFHARFARGAPDQLALSACQRHAGLIVGLSGERIRDELFRILLLDRVEETLALMAATGVLSVALPVALNRDRLAAWLSLAASAREAGDPLLRLRLLLPDRAEVLADIARRLRLSGAERARLLACAEPLGAVASAADLRLQAQRQGLRAMRDRLWLAAAGGLMTPAALAEQLAVLDSWAPRRLPVDGGDLQALGLMPGPRLGAVLAQLETWWFARDCQPDRAMVLAEARALLARP